MDAHLTAPVQSETFPPARTKMNTVHVEGFLCRAWGETDLPEARLVRSQDEWEAFVVEAQWGPGVTLDSLDAEEREQVAAQIRYIKADMADNSAGEMCFEIGGISVEHVTFLSINPTAAQSPKYDDVLRPFLTLMRRELHANCGKGDRPGWLAMRPDEALLEVYYHLAKLQKAVRDNDGPAIMEYSADVANMSMMVLDICGGLAWVEPVEGSSQTRPSDEKNSVPLNPSGQAIVGPP